MCLIFHIEVLRLNNPIYVFCKKAAFLGSHIESVNSNLKKINVRNGLLMCNAMRKVLLIYILSQIVQKLGFIMRLIVVILAVILDFSVGSMISACYPP